MNHTQKLREVAKFLSGLITGDLLVGVWMLSAGLLPQNFLGLKATSQVVWLGIGFDAFLLLILVHYAWHPKAIEPKVSSRFLFFVIGVITGTVTLVHFFRLVFGWVFIVGDWSAPMWLSWIGVFVAGFISYASFHLAAKKNKR